MAITLLVKCGAGTWCTLRFGEGHVLRLKRVAVGWVTRYPPARTNDRPHIVKPEKLTQLRKVKISALAYTGMPALGDGLDPRIEPYTFRPVDVVVTKQ